MTDIWLREENGGRLLPDGPAETLSMTDASLATFRYAAILSFFSSLIMNEGAVPLARLAKYRLALTKAMDTTTVCYNSPGYAAYMLANYGMVADVWMPAFQGALQDQIDLIDSISAGGQPPDAAEQIQLATNATAIMTASG